MIINDTHKSFAVIIISHGRPEDIPTIKSLKNAGYSGKIYILVDDEDKDCEQYKLNYDNVKIFNKKTYIDKSITFNVDPLVNVAVHARNAAEDLAKNLNLAYFLLLDDDIINFQFKFVVNSKLSRSQLTNIDDILDVYIDYINECNIACLGLAHDGFFLGGNITIFNKPAHSHFRLLANAFIRNTKFNVVWGPDMCEDFITSIYSNRNDDIWISLPFISCSCKVQGMNKKKVDGGNSNVYIENGNYGVAIYSVLALPDCYRLKLANKLWFECIDYNLTVPMIISDKYRKGD